MARQALGIAVLPAPLWLWGQAWEGGGLGYESFCQGQSWAKEQRGHRAEVHPCQS